MEHLDKIESVLDKAVVALDKKIARLLSDLNTKGGLIISDEINLARATKMRSEIAAEFSVYYDAARESTSTYSTVGARVKKGFKGAGIDMSFSDVDAGIVRVFANDTLASLASLGSKVSADIGAMVYSSVVSGGDLAEITASTRQMLVGGMDKRGVPMVSHAKTIATSKYMDIDAMMMKKKSEELGIKKWRYDGSLIKDSRPFCAANQGQAFTLEEIQAWEGDEWQGKAAGDPFVVRGGWQCRHFFSPIP